MDRYARQIVLPQVGPAGQARLATARVLVVGAGGLGCPVLHYLAAAGVGQITVADGDTVDLGNLHRQLLYAVDDVGAGKAGTAARRLREQGFEARVEAVAAHLGPHNARALVSSHDVVVDCTDDLFTRYLINDACVQDGKPFVHGSLHRFSGQVAVFNHGNGPTYRCAFPREPGAGEVPDCADAGVLGVLPGVVGTLQAAEVLKLLLGIGGLLNDGILLVDLLTHRHQRLGLQRDPAQVARAQARDIEREGRAATACSAGEEAIELEAGDLLERMARGEPWQTVDVRGPEETPQLAGLTMHRIPLHELEARAGELDRERPVLLYCASGVRSRTAANILLRLGFRTVRSLRGGVRAWPVADHRPLQPERSRS